MDVPDPKTKARWIVEAALDLKAERPVALDMRSLTSFADSFIILTGRSDRQVRSIADAVVDVLKANAEPPLGVEGRSPREGRSAIRCKEASAVHVGFRPSAVEARAAEQVHEHTTDAGRARRGVEKRGPIFFRV